MELSREFGQFTRRLNIQEHDGWVGAALRHGKQLPVGAHFRNQSSSILTKPFQNLFSGGCFPQVESVLTDRDYPFAVGCEPHSPDSGAVGGSLSPAVGLQTPDFLAAGGIPQPHGIVRT